MIMLKLCFIHLVERNETNLPTLISPTMTSLQDVYLIMVHLMKVEGFMVAGGKELIQVREVE